MTLLPGQSGWVEFARRHYGLVFPFAVLGAILVIVLPIPPLAMDLLLAVSITLAIAILMATVSISSPLELSIFPSLLLVTTLFRLVLNIASTRLILSKSESTATAAAGRMIQQFGELVAGNQLAIGFVIFMILVVVQFVVITKGATRISEVSARFILDAIPGRQMAIDADLSAGIIDETTAREQRADLVRQSDFLGAMDGAARFVRGDAIAGLIITAINVLGGLAIGVFSYGMSLSEALTVYTKLTIGDGLASQVPALIIAIAAGLLTTRSSQPTRLGEEVVGQLTARPEVPIIAGAFAVVLALGNFPRIPLLSLAAVCFLAGYFSWQKTKETAEEDPETDPQPIPQPVDRIEDFLVVDPIALEIGYGLLKFLDGSGNSHLMSRLQGLRKQLAEELGIILPKVRIRDNLHIGPQDYLVRIRGIEVASGTIPPDRLLAFSSRKHEDVALGVPTDFDWLPNAWWIKQEQRAHAERLGYVLTDGLGALVQHLRELIHRNAAELLSRDQVKRLIDGLRETSPTLVDEIIPDVLSTGEVHRVLQNLLRESRSIRDLETILEAVGDHAAATRDSDELAGFVKRRLDDLQALAGQARMTSAA